MIQKAGINYLKKSIEKHIEINMSEDALSAFKSTKILWVKADEIIKLKDCEKPTIIIPILKKKKDDFYKHWSINFRGTKLKLWGHISPPSKEWLVEDTKNLVWYKRDKNFFLCSWDLVNILFELLVLKEETTSKLRDRHGRFLGRFSIRYKYQTLEVPIFNNSAALLVEKCLKIQKPYTYKKKKIAKPLKIILSHDVDALRGDDFWSQGARLYKFLKPLIKIKPPNFVQLWCFL